VSGADHVHDPHGLGCENDARRFGERVATHYAEKGEDAAVAMARADRSAGGNRAVSFARGALVMISVALPLIASTLVGGKGPWVSTSRRRSRHSSRSRWSSASASPSCAAETHTHGRYRPSEADPSRWGESSTRRPRSGRSNPITHVKYPRPLGAPGGRCNPRRTHEVVPAPSKGWRLVGGSLPHE
jgi:hypothetical protein